MTHPKRYEAPYAPKAGETWKHYIDGPVVINEANEFGCGYYLFGVAKEDALSAFTQRHFRDQAERDAAPAIPPVEGARMLLKKGIITDKIKIYSNINGINYEPHKIFFDGCWRWLSGGHYKESLEKYCYDCIAVHTWPEDIK